MVRKETVPPERLKEQIKYAIEILRWYVVIIIALTSGEVNLVFKEDLSAMENLFRNAGLIIVLGTGIVIYFQNKYIYKLIKKIKE